MKWRPIAVLFVLGALASSAGAQGNLTPPQILRHDVSITGAGTSPSPAGVHVATGGGITTGGGTTGVSLLTTCTTGQVEQWDGAAWVCADNASQVAGTSGHIPYFAPDGAHLGDTPITYNGTDTINAPITDHMSLGQGAPAGAPTGTITAVLCSGATTPACSATGIITAGTRSYAYDEHDSMGITPLSTSIATVTSAGSQEFAIGVPLPRPGMGERHVCRTKAGGTTYYDLHNFGGGNNFFSTSWVDNVDDSALVTPCPTTDTTAIYTLELNGFVKTFRTPPSTAAVPHDVTFITGDPSVAGVFAIDSYGTIVARTINGSGFEGIKYGLTGSNQIDLYWVSDVDPGAGFAAGGTLTEVFTVGPQGSVQINPAAALKDTGATISTRALTINATMPSVTTGAHTGAYVDITSAGSSSNSQYAFAAILEPNYSGSSNTYAGSATNGVAGTGIEFGWEANASGAASDNVGLSGVAYNGTHNVAVFAGLGVHPTAGRDAAIVADNGSTNKSLIRAYNSNSGSVLEFEATSAGGIFGSPAGAYLSADGALGYQAGTNATATGYINYYGYAPANVPGTTQFRNLIIADGKGATACTLTGSTKTLNCTGLQVGGVAVSTTTGTVTSIATSSGITGGTITSTGTIGYDSAVIQSRVTGTCTGPNSIRAVASDGSVTCTTGVLNTGNLAGTTNHLIKITGTNTGGDSTVIDDGTQVTTTELLGLNTTTPKGQLAVLTGDAGTAFNDLTGTLTPAKWALVGPGASSTSGEFLALGYSTTEHAAKIAAIQGGTAWERMDLSASSYQFDINNVSKMTYNGTTLAITGGLTTTTTVVATGNVTGSSLIAGTTNSIGWGDLTTKIAGSNSGAGSGSMQFNTNSAVRAKVDNTGLWTFGTNSADAPGASNTTVIVSNLGTTCSEVRDSTNDVEDERCASSSGGFGGTFTNHSYFLQTNATNALKIDTAQQVEALAAFKVDGNTTIGNANTNTLTMTAKINSHVYYNGTAPTYSCAGATVDTASTDERGRIVTPDTSCVLTFAVAYTTNPPFCTANASTNIPVGVTATVTAATFTMGSKPASMTWHCDGGL